MCDKQMTLSEKLAHLHGVVVFFIVLLASNWIWKMSVIGDDNDIYTVSLFGLFDISRFFDFATTNLTRSVTVTLHLFGIGAFANGNYISFANGEGVHIIWGCTAVKQMFIFACIILCSRGAWKHKAWFIPLGFVLIHLTNIARIASLAVISENHIGIVPFLHAYIFKYAFYAIIFAIWMTWDMFFATKKEASTAAED